MDDKLYILAVIAWVAYSFYSAYKKSQKKRQEAPPVVQPELEEEQPEPEWYDTTYDHRQVDKTPPVIKSAYKPITETYFQSDDSIEELSSIENISVEKLQQDAQKFSQKNQVADTNEGKLHMFDINFDESELRKAIIYSEIINRKY